MRTLLVLAAIIGLSAPSFAQTAEPKVGGKPAKQVKPLAPMGCKLVGTSRGPSFGPATARALQNLGVRRPLSGPSSKQIPPLPNNSCLGRPRIRSVAAPMRARMHPRSRAA
jgi:hypothetical protein